MSGEMVLPELRVGAPMKRRLSPRCQCGVQVEGFFKRGDRTDAAEIRI